jgi:hypothetical protein
MSEGRFQRLRLPALILVALLAPGCLRTGNLQITPVALAAHKPANVVLYVAVNQDDRGLTYLTARNFRVYENGVALDSDQVELTLLPATTVAARRVALLVDMSRALDDQQRTQMANSLATIIGKLRQRQPVSLFAFDGSEKAQWVAELPRGLREERYDTDIALAKLLQFRLRDSSSSLYSAILDTAGKLDHAFAYVKQPLRRGTLIVIAQNPDLAGRVSEPQARQFVDSSPHQYFLLTVGKWATATDVSWLGKTAALQAASFNTMSSPLDQIADLVENDYFRYYVVSYCSPARAGTRQLRLEVTLTDSSGQKLISSYDTVFEAKDFGPSCHSHTIPNFAPAAPAASEAAARGTSEP